MNEKIAVVFCGVARNYQLPSKSWPVLGEADYFMITWDKVPTSPFNSELINAWNELRNFPVPLKATIISNFFEYQHQFFSFRIDTPEPHRWLYDQVTNDPTWTKESTLLTNVLISAACSGGTPDEWAEEEMSKDLFRRVFKHSLLWWNKTEPSLAVDVAGQMEYMLSLMRAPPGDLTPIIYDKYDNGNDK